MSNERSTKQTAGTDPQGRPHAVVVPLPVQWAELECMHIDALVQTCGMFTCDTDLNNGYGCLAPQNTEAPGCCHTFACPIATDCDDEDTQWCDTYSEGEWMIVHSRFERHNAEARGAEPNCGASRSADVLGAGGPGNDEQ